MTDPIDDRLRESLAAMSRPTDGEPVLARRALDQIDREHSSVRSHEPRLRDRSVNWHARIPNALLGAMVALLLLVTAAAVFVPSAGRARLAGGPSNESVDVVADTIAESVASDAIRNARAAEPKAEALPAIDAPVPTPHTAALATNMGLTEADMAIAQFAKSAGGAAAAEVATPSELADAAPVSPSPRIIVRAGSCEIEVTDLDGARARLADLLRPDLGEFTQDTALALDQFRPAATLTVRIAPERFERFNADLERLGTVRSLQSTATDQTDQIVDLDTRLRNERHLESEVRDLLESRLEADLDDILRVRTTLGEIRQSVERLEAQRSNLLARASLATVRITLIGPAPAHETPSPSAFGDRLGDAVSDGWRTCTRSVLWLIEALVSGLMWWALFGVAVWVLFGRYRRSRAWR